MVNGRTLLEEEKKIEEFFQEMSIEEFENMMLECGAYNIDESYESNYVLAFEPDVITEQRYINNIAADYGSEFEKDFVHKHCGQDNLLGAA